MVFVNSVAGVGRCSFTGRDINVKLPFYPVAELAPKMAGHGSMAEHGSEAIVNVTTQAASYGQPVLPRYGTAHPRRRCSC